MVEGARPMPTRPLSFYAVVLAGGRSTRMRSDKRFLVFDGEMLVDRAMALATQALGSDPARVLLCGEVPDRPGIPDERAGMGPLGGVHTALAKLQGGAETADQWLVVLPVDMPLLSASPLIALMARASECARRGIRAVGFTESEFPFAFLGGQRTLAILEEILKKEPSSARSVRAFCEGLEVVRYPADPEGRRVEEFLNANTPEEWSRATERGTR